MIIAYAKPEILRKLHSVLNMNHYSEGQDRKMVIERVSGCKTIYFSRNSGHQIFKFYNPFLQWVTQHVLSFKTIYKLFNVCGLYPLNGLGSYLFSSSLNIHILRIPSYLTLPTFLRSPCVPPINLNSSKHCSPSVNISIPPNSLSP